MYIIIINGHKANTSVIGLTGFVLQNIHTIPHGTRTDSPLEIQKCPQASGRECLLQNNKYNKQEYDWNGMLTTFQHPVNHGGKIIWAKGDRMVYLYFCMVGNGTHYDDHDHINYNN